MSLLIKEFGRYLLNTLEDAVLAFFNVSEDQSGKKSIII